MDRTAAVAVMATAAAMRAMPRPGPSSAREQALAVFDLEPPLTQVRLKARYKVLVKSTTPTRMAATRPPRRS